MELRYHIGDILSAYRMGLYPMAEDAEADTFFFYEPELRGILPIRSFHLPRSLRKSVSKGKYHVSVDRCFRDVIEGCAESTSARPKTWINSQIKEIFLILYQAGYAHSIEVRDKSGRLAGGLYGLALGGAFFGESMFSRQTDASKTALVHLMARLWAGGFVLCDIQCLNSHLRQFGAYEIPRTIYKGRLQKALNAQASFLLPHETPRQCKGEVESALGRDLSSHGRLLHYRENEETEEHEQRNEGQDAAGVKDNAGLSQSAPPGQEAKTAPTGKSETTKEAASPLLYPGKTSAAEMALIQSYLDFLKIAVDEE